MRLKKRLCLLLILIHTLGITAVADEGIWPFNNVPTAEIKRRYGFEVTSAWLKKVQLACVRFNNGASGSFVSRDGLVMTNHHVASDTLQKLGTAEENYYQDGFYAEARRHELRAPDLELNILVSIEDVTDRVNKAVRAEMGPAEATDARQAEISVIEKESLAATNLRSDVVALYRGGQYHLYRYKTYTDVRLVFAPEFDVAFFGGDPDNFSYPKYSLDIAFFRVYENDRPLKVEDYLEFSQHGVEENELVFTAGHPGSTARLNTVAHLEFLRDTALPFSIRQFTNTRDALRAYSRQGKEQARRAQEDLFSAENGLKRTRGQLAGLQDKSLMAIKQRAEESLRRKIAAQPDKQKLYGKIWEEIAASRSTLTSRFLEISFLESVGILNSVLFNHARTLVRLAEESAKPDAERLPEYSEARRASLLLSLFSPAPIYKDFEKAKLTASFRLLLSELGRNHQVVKKILLGKTPEARAAEIIDGTQLNDVAYRKQLVSGGIRAITESSDPMIIMARSIDPEARTIRRFYEPLLGAERTNYGKLARALYEIEGSALYPDATFTLRLSYGAVKGYRERGRWVHPFTTFAGIYQRAARHGNRPPFRLPKRWLQNKGSLDLKRPINFISTNESIGGSSGSPVINKEAKIVGVIFDGNAQSLAGHFIYEPTQNRAISVDARAIIEALWKIYGAKLLAGELEMLRRGE